MAYLSNTQELRGMAKTPMTKFMAQDSNDFLGFALFDQCIVDNNVLLPRQAIEISVAVRTPLTAVNHIQLRQGEVQLLS